jgi:hypothetical protein
MWQDVYPPQEMPRRLGAGPSDLGRAGSVGDGGWPATVAIERRRDGNVNPGTHASAARRGSVAAELGPREKPLEGFNRRRVRDARNEYGDDALGSSRSGGGGEIEESRERIAKRSRGEGNGDGARMQDYPCGTLMRHSLERRSREHGRGAGQPPRSSVDGDGVAGARGTDVIGDGPCQAAVADSGCNVAQAGATSSMQQASRLPHGSFMQRCLRPPRGEEGGGSDGAAWWPPRGGSSTSEAVYQAARTAIGNESDQQDASPAACGAGSLLSGIWRQGDEQRSGTARSGHGHGGYQTSSAPARCQPASRSCATRSRRGRDPNARGAPG